MPAADVDLLDPKTFLRRIPDLEHAAGVARSRSTFTDGIKSMPVRSTPGS